MNLASAALLLPPRIEAPAPAKPSLFAQMIQSWLAHNQRMLDMRTGPF